MNIATPADPQIQAELSRLGLRWVNCVSWNDDATTLVDMALERGEGELSNKGAFVATTGTHTGRSPQDKYILLDAKTAKSVWWDNNQGMTLEHFNLLKRDFMDHARLRSVFVQDANACADEAYQLPVRVITEKAWHALFMKHLLRKPNDDNNFTPKLTIINLPSFKADPARHGTRSQTVIAFDFTNGLVLIGGTAYAGEMKKAVFTMLNFLLPEQKVLPMHCSANVGQDGTSAVFFGLSGTGKTTLSADPNRLLIGDDEHGWSEHGIFNFEGGCYAKAINLSEAQEPAIFKAATARHTVLENVMLDHTGAPDFNNVSLTDNTRAAYPLDAIEGIAPRGHGAVPKTIIMLTADAFGVLPAIAKLNAEQAMYHFLAGYTAKVAGTERGVTEPQATFSACFGAPFLPLPPTVYGAMLQQLIRENDVQCYLINTGWTGGKPGIGQRFPLNVTRAIVNAALSGELKTADTVKDPNFGFDVPQRIKAVDPKWLAPRAAWADGEAYDAAAQNLVVMFEKNEAKHETKRLAAE